MVVQSHPLWHIFTIEGLVKGDEFQMYIFLIYVLQSSTEFVLQINLEWLEIFL